MLYGYETWRLTERNKGALEATEIATNDIRQSMGILRKKNVRIEKVEQRMGIDNELRRKETTNLIRQCAKNGRKWTLEISNGIDTSVKMKEEEQYGR